MEKIYKIGIIGFGHMHINDVAAHFAENPRTELVACADVQPLVEEVRVAPYTRKWNQERALTKLGVKHSYDCYKEMLEKEELDLVIVTTEVQRHAEVVTACARKGVGVCIEKPMAMNFSQGVAMVREAEGNNSLLMVNWPVTWNGAARTMKALLDDGAIGRVLQFKYRAAHTGPLGFGAKHAGVAETAQPMSEYEKARTWWHQKAAGGGAMLDFCCYGCLVGYWFVGAQAQAAMGMQMNLASTWGDAEDNAAMLVRFPEAYAVLEGSWTTYNNGVPSGPIVYGTEGTMVLDMQDGKPVIRVITPDGKTRLVAGEPLPEGRGDISQEFVHHMDTGEPLHITLDKRFNLEALAILDAGARSAASGKMELVNGMNWSIG